MSIPSRLVNVVAWTIPSYSRQRYREEWQADLAGALELELPQHSVVGGALMTAITIDRTDPRVTGLTMAQLIARRMCWAAALLGSAAVLGAGLFLWGRYDLLGFHLAGTIIQVLALLCAALGLFACLGALLVAVAVNGRRTASVIGLGVVAVVVTLGTMLFIPLVGFVGVPVILAIMIISMSGKRETSGSGPAYGSRGVPARRRVFLALVFTALTVATIAVGVVHITVWNPLAKAPGLSLDEIYAAMAAANESPVDGFITGWAIFWGVAALLLPIAGSIRALSGFITTRRIAVAGLLLVGATAATHWLAGFNMGMSMADTFMTSGGDAAMSGPILGLVGTIALVAALLIGLLPRRRVMKVVETGAQ